MQHDREAVLIYLITRPSGLLTVTGDTGSNALGHGAEVLELCQSPLQMAERFRRDTKDDGDLAPSCAVGAATGTVGGILGIEDRPRFREYVIHEHPRSYHYSGDLRVGGVLPETVTYYDVLAEYHVTGYRYAYLNDHAVLVEPRARQIVEVVE